MQERRLITGNPHLVPGPPALWDSQPERWRCRLRKEPLNVRA
jgi:hypothetical protein